MTTQPVSASSRALSSVLSGRRRASQAEIVDFCDRWHVEELSLFGSVIRNDFRPNSDIDVLVVFDPSVKRGLFDQMEAKQALAALFGRKVDLTEKRLLKNPFSKVEILQTCRIIYPPERANFTAFIRADERMTDDIRNNAALLDMLDSMRSLQEFIQNRTFEDYLEDRFLRKVVERELEIVGEAANRLMPAFQSAHSELDWGSVVGLRNAIVHQYDELDHENIWAIATTKVPQLLEQVQPLLQSLPDESGEA